MIVDFSFHGEQRRGASNVKVKFIMGTPISVFVKRFFAKFAIAKFFVFAIICLFVKENKWMYWVQGMVKQNG